MSPGAGEDPFALARFVAAQDKGGTYERALSELRSGRKRTHWMWFVFPQLAGLGRSSISSRYAIGSLAEARAYLAHPVLGPRLQACAEALDSLERADASQILGDLDALKLRSSMTLFARSGGSTGGPDNAFERVLGRYFDGIADPATEALLAGAERA